MVARRYIGIVLAMVLMCASSCREELKPDFELVKKIKIIDASEACEVKHEEVILYRPVCFYSTVKYERYEWFVGLDPRIGTEATYCMTFGEEYDSIMVVLVGHYFLNENSMTDTLRTWIKPTAAQNYKLYGRYQGQIQGSEGDRYMIIDTTSGLFHPRMFYFKSNIFTDIVGLDRVSITTHHGEWGITPNAFTVNSQGITNLNGLSGAACLSETTDILEFYFTFENQSDTLHFKGIRR